MGTAGLVIGIGLIVFGFIVIYYGFFGNTATTLDGFIATLLGSLIVGIFLIFTGGLLLVKHDREKKNQKLVSPQTLKGVGIGIIAVSIIWGASLGLTYQTFTMANDIEAMGIKKGDLVRFDNTPFHEIQINDMISYYDNDKVLVHKVISVDSSKVPRTLTAQSTVSGINNLVTEDQYIGKLDSVIKDVGGIRQVFSPPVFIIILIAVFVTPIVIMKISGSRKPENS